MITNVKMQVTPDLSERIQEIVFVNDGRWSSGDREVILTHVPFLIIENNILSNIKEKKNFKCDKNKEVSAYDFIASQGQQEWLPKYGEEYEFSDDTNFDDAITTNFSCYEPSSEYPFGTINSSSYRYCRPLKQTKTITIDGKDIEISKDSFESLKQQLCKG